MKYDIHTIIRTAILVLALLNQGLALFNLSPLQISDEQLGDFITLAFTMSSAIWSWWKNNNITPEAIEAQTYLNDLKALKKNKSVTIEADNIATGTIQSKSMQVNLGEGSITFHDEEN